MMNVLPQDQNQDTTGVADAALLQRLQDGDESAYVCLLDSYQMMMLRIAAMYVHSPDAAEDVVQETWIGVLQGIRRFEGRSTLKTWIFSILVNRARTRAQREGRYVPISALEEVDSAGPTVPPERFNPADHDRWPHHWSAPPHSWEQVPEDQLLSQETQAVIRQAIARLSVHQREVITLRDIEGLASDEVCNVLGLSETNQRVLLHRA